MRTQGLLLILLRLSATTLIHPTWEGSTGLQVAAAAASTTSTNRSILRLLSFADKTSDAHTDDSNSSSKGDDDSSGDDSTAPASPYDVPSATSSSKSGIDDDLFVRPNATKTNKTAKGTISTSTHKKHHTNSTANTTTTGAIATVSEWDLPNQTVDPMTMTTNNTVLLPPEQAQPTVWPVVVFSIFVLLAAGLCTVTCLKSCKNKRKNYEEIESLIV
jgi:hypothetical protein